MEPNYRKEWQFNWRRTLKGKASTMYTSLLKRTKYHPNYHNIQCLISRQDFMDWAIPALKDWIAKGNPLTGSNGASLDRIDGEGHYEVSNIQIISRRDNSKKHGINFKLHNQKQCTKCKLILFKTSFHKDKSRGDGLAYFCKVCAQKRDAIRKLAK